MEISGLFPFDTDLVVQIIATRYSIDALNLTTVANWYAWYDNSKDMRCHRPRQVVSKASKFLFMYIVPHVDSATDGSNVVEDGNEKDQLCVPDGKQDEHVTRPSTVNPLFSFWLGERTWVFRSNWWPWITAGYQGESPPDDCWLSLQGQRLEILGILFSLILWVMYHCDWRSIGGVYAYLLLILYYLIVNSLSVQIKRELFYLTVGIGSA
ncbi:hypothetical protein Tco_1031655 [Tanacetum coccineum]|uniref:Uncharacterized protein n=1 Tax=Tanacetum coccineum TaxID=301880 RepID=A0ABQ5G9U1_9ASTR